MDFTGFTLIPTGLPQDVIDAVGSVVPAAATPAIQIAILASVVGLGFRLVWKALGKARKAA